MTPKAKKCSPDEVPENRHPDGGKSTCKGPEVGGSKTHEGNCQEAGVARTLKVREPVS